MTLDQAFEVLGIPASSTEAEVSARYRHLAMVTHPDTPSGSALGESAMVELNLARDRALEHAHQRAEERRPKRKCGRCKGKRKVKVSSGFATVEVACPDCSVPREE